MTDKKRLPVVQSTPPVRVLDMATDYETGVLTARVRLNGTFFEEEVVLDLKRFEHSNARELVNRLNDLVLHWRNEAGQKNCGTCVGMCCTSHWDQGISVTNEDARILAEHLNIPFDAFTSKHLIEVPGPGDDAWIFRWRKDAASPTGACCPFLKFDKKGQGKCSVYEVRPRVCREFTAHGCDVYQKPGG